MGKPKPSQDNSELEAQLRSMILGNVRIADPTPSAGAPGRNNHDRSQRGAGHYVPPHQRSRGPNQTQAEASMNSSGVPSSAFAPSLHSNSPPQYHVQQRSRSGDFAQTRQGPQQGWTQRNPSRSMPAKPPPGLGPGKTAPFVSPETLQRPRALPQPKSQGGATVHAGRFQKDRPPPNPPPMAAFMAQCEYLDQIANAEIPLAEMPPLESAAKEAFRAQLELICQAALKASHPELDSTMHLRCYGSLASGFATTGSDVDLTVVWEGPTPDDPTFIAQLPRVLEQGILNAGHGARLLSRTRVPILKICETPSQDLFDALKEERKKWEDLPDEEKYPSLIPQSPAQETEAAVGRDESENTKTIVEPESRQIDPDLSRNGKAMESVRRSAGKSDTFHLLEQLKSTERSQDDDMHKYYTQFVNAASKLLQTNEIDDATACQYFLHGLPPAVRDEVTKSFAAQGYDYTSGSFAKCYDVAVPVISRIEAAKPKKAQKSWLREKTLGPLDFPKVGVGIQCDINFSNALAIHNTRLLRCYSYCDPRVRPMILFVKAWAKKRKINSAYSGTLSSYGYVLMVLHFLINVAKPPVVPNLQHAFGAGQKEVMMQGYNISFWEDEQQIRLFASQGRLTQNHEPLGVLLRNFFHYYAVQGHYVIGGGFSWTKDVLSIRTPMGIRSKEGKGWTGAKTVNIDGREVRQRYLFAIEDPFELDHNVARPVTHNGIVTIRDEFRRTWRILQAVGNFKEPEGGLFDAIEETIPLPSPKEEANGSSTVAGADERVTNEGNEAQKLT